MKNQTVAVSNQKIEWYEMEKGQKVVVRTPNGDKNLHLTVAGVTKIDQIMSNPNGVVAVELESQTPEKFRYVVNRAELHGPFVHYRTEVLAFFKEVDGKGANHSTSAFALNYERRWTIVEAFAGVMKYELGKSISKEGEPLIVVRRIEIEPEDAMVYVYNDDNQLAVMQRADNFTAVYGYADVLLTPEEQAAKMEGTE